MLTNTIKLYRESFSGLSKEVWLLAWITLINRSGTMVIPFLTVFLTAELKFTFAEAGLVMSCFGLGSVIGSYIGGQLTDKIGDYLVQFWSLFLGGLALISLMFFTSFYGFCIAVFYVSIISDAFRPAMMSAVGVYSKPENRARALSLIRLAINLGFAVGPAIGGLLAASVGYDWLFIVDGVTCMAGALMLRWVLKPKKSEKEAKQNSLKTTKVTSAYRDYPFLLFLGLMLLNALTFMQLFFTMPVFFKDVMLLTEDQIGFLLAMNGALIAIIEMPLIYKLEKKNSKMVFITIGVVFIALGCLVLNWQGIWIWAAVFSILFFTIGEIINFPFSNTIALNRSNDQNRGQYMGLYAMTFSVAFTIAPTVGFFIAETWNFEILWYCATVFNFIAAIGFWVLRKYMMHRQGKAITEKERLEELEVV